jgi:predicted XRE-type DNA-binding protein
LLAGEVAAVIRRLGLTQAGAALILGADQPKVSRLLNGQIEEFSPERLLTFLTLLGRDVEIVVRRPKMDLAAVGRLRVVSVEEGTA